MTASPFTPLGVESRRAILVRLVGETDHGVVLTYEHLSEVLGGVSRRTIQREVNKAQASMEREHSKTVEAVDRVGYRVVLPSEHLSLAVRQQKKSRRALRRSHSKVTHVDYGALTPGEQAAVTLAASSLALQMQYMRRNDLRVGRLERAVSEVHGSTTEKHERTSAQISVLLERLERLEKASKVLGLDA